MFYASNYNQQNDFAFQVEGGLASTGRLFEEARQGAMIGILLSWLGLKRKMIMLSERLAGQSIQRQYSAGLRTVEVSRIRGSESRSQDFDGSFAPLSDRIRDRWTGIARARLSRQPLPPVELIQVKEEYFVRDGHHRVSVARSLGTAFIDADVTVIEI